MCYVMGYLCQRAGSAASSVRCFDIVGARCVLVLAVLFECVHRAQSSVSHWKLSPHENRMRMRPKLVPNNKFDPHVEASRLRDNEGGGTFCG